MQYGYFDDENKEYVITRPDTPSPWANYLGSPEFGAIISNNAGGYSFEKSGADGRILRYVFNDSDRPGRYIYLRDNTAEDFWSVSWQPVGKDLSSAAYECRHGTAYTVLKSVYRGIEASACYYIPLGKTHEVWHVSLKNNSAETRNLTVTGYAEFTNNSSYEQDQVNLQYSQFITRTEFRGNRIRQLIHGNLLEAGTGAQHDVCQRFFGVAGAQVSSYCGDKKEFLGNYRSYQNPQGIETGDLGNRLNYCGNSCGALSVRLLLSPGEEKEFSFILGMKSDEEAAEILSAHCCPSAEIEELKNYWHSKLARFKVKTPCPEFDSMVNVWNAYNCFITFTWSRAASFVYCGLRNGYGYRDTVQDIQGIIHLAPEMAREKLVFMLSAQVDNGGGLPLVRFTHNPGHEDTPDDDSYVRETGHPAYRADDALWLFPTVYQYIAESGELSFLDLEIPFANRDSGTVYEHLRRAISFSLERLGPHGLPAGLYADWNDCLRLGENGESTFVAFQFIYALSIMEKFAERKHDASYSAFLSGQKAAFQEKISALCWDQDRFIRGFTQSGEVIGKRDAKEYNLWLNPQSWSVISGAADRSQAEAVLENVHSRLNTPFGAILMDPPFRTDVFEGALAAIYNPGTKENSAVFSQTQGWLILAEALAGHGNRAFEYYMENCPAAQNSIAEKRVLEPYIYGQFTEGKASPFLGRSHVHWLTGTASTVMVGSVEGILGIRPGFDGLEISPALPQSWDKVSIEKDFRGKKLFITIRNPNSHESGFGSMTLNGKKLNNPLIPENLLEDVNYIEYTIL